MGEELITITAPTLAKAQAKADAEIASRHLDDLLNARTLRGGDGFMVELTFREPSEGRDILALVIIVGIIGAVGMAAAAWVAL